MARRIVSDEVIADEIINRLSQERLRDRWRNFVLSHFGKEKDEEEKISTATGYILREEPELTEWLEIFFPYMERRLNNTLIDDVIKDYFGEEFYRENVLPF